MTSCLRKSFKLCTQIFLRLRFLPESSHDLETNSRQLEPPAVRLSFRWEVPRMWGGCGLHPNDISFSLFSVWLGQGEECYHWSVSHPDPPLPLSHHFTCKCVYVSYVVLMSCTSCLCTRVMLVHNGEWREHPRVRCVHTCEAGKAVVSHPQASIALLPWVTLSRYSTSLPCPPPPPPSPPFSSLNQRWLPPFPLSPPPMTSSSPSPNTLLWWITLYVEIFFCSSPQTKQQYKPEGLARHRSVFISEGWGRLASVTNHMQNLH